MDPSQQAPLFSFGKTKEPEKTKREKIEDIRKGFFKQE